MGTDHGKKPEPGIHVPQFPSFLPSPATLYNGEQQENQDYPPENTVNL
jgi:hypothetical protein